MEIEYKFLKVRKCIFFAKVFVEIGDPSETPIVRVSVHKPINEGSMETSPEYYSDWWSAAETGAMEALCEIKTLRQLKLIPAVTITRVLGTIVDTTIDAVHCASAMATCKALLGDIHMPTITHTGEKWVVNYQGLALKLENDRV